MNDIEVVLQSLKQSLLRFDADALVDAVLLLARNGQLPAGTRLPTIAAMGKALGLSPSTVSRAWASLVQMGVIETKRRGGTRIARPVEATSYRSRGLEQQRFLHYLSPGYPDPTLQIDLGAMLHRVADNGEFHGYLGKDLISDRLRSALLRRIGYSPEAMLLDTEVIGTLPRILQAVSHRGAFIGIGNPEFPLYGVILKQSGMTPSPIAFSSSGYDLSQIEEALSGSVRVLLLQTRVHNPTGLMVPTENLAAIAAILRRYDATAIEVDHHGSLVPETNVRLASFAPERTVLLASFAKDIHADLRVSGIFGPSAILDRIAIWRAGGDWVSAVNRQLLEECLADPEVERSIAAANLEYGRRRETFRKTLSRSGTEVLSNAGLSLWVPVVSEQETLLRLAAEGISVAPGSAFDLGEGVTPHIHLSLGSVGAYASQLSETVAKAANIRQKNPGYF